MFNSGKNSLFIRKGEKIGKGKFDKSEKALVNDKKFDNPGTSVATIDNESPKVKSIIPKLIFHPENGFKMTSDILTPELLDKLEMINISTSLLKENNQGSCLAKLKQQTKELSQELINQFILNPQEINRQMDIAGSENKSLFLLSPLTKNNENSATDDPSNILNKIDHFSINNESYEKSIAVKSPEELDESEDISMQNNCFIMPVKGLKFSPLETLEGLSTIGETINESTQEVLITDENPIENISGFNIDENGKFLGIIIGITTRNEAINILNKYSRKRYPDDTIEPIIVFDDIDITLYFDEMELVNAIEFGEGFGGRTEKGLKIWDSIDKALELYGPPRIVKSKGAFWTKVKVLFNCADLISSIKIQK